jgi:hypothetical protein
MEFDPFGLSIKDISTGNVITRLSNASSVICSRRTQDLCHAYQLGRHTRMSFVSSASRADNNFDLIHCGLWTSPFVSIYGCKYYLVILDDRSHFVWTFPLRMKFDIFSHCQIFHPCFHVVWPHHQNYPV